MLIRPTRLDRWIAFAVVLLSALFASGSVSAAPITLNGVTFSEAGPGVLITGGVAGSGALGDPLIISETFTSLDGTISIEGLQNFGNPTGSSHAHGFALRKIITNNTGASWEFFDHELQVTLGIPSSDDDGLSFGQGCATCRPFTSDNLPTPFEEIILRDFVNFSGGVVPDLGMVTFDYVITDNLQHELVFLRERPDFAPPEAIPEPATLLLFGSSVAGMAGALWRRRRKQDTPAA